MNRIIRQTERIVLASTSPRRRELLIGAGIDIEVIAPITEEVVLPGEQPIDLVKRLSHLKAESVSKGIIDRWVIGSDTIVVCDNEILGKPEEALQARQMLRKLSGRKHQVVGGISLLNNKKGIAISKISCTDVDIAPLTEQFIEWYVSTGEPMDKAGAYAAQGIGAQFVSQVKGSYTNVVGLDLDLIASLLREVGVLYF